MKKYLILSLCLVTVLMYHKDDDNMTELLVSSPMNCFEIKPTRRDTVVSPYHRYIYPQALGNRAQWIKVHDIGV